MKFGQFISYYKKKVYQKIIQKLRQKTSSRPLSCLKRSKRNLYWKMKFLKQATYVRFVTAKLSKFIKIDVQASSDSFLQKFFEN